MDLNQATAQLATSHRDLLTALAIEGEITWADLQAALFLLDKIESGRRWYFDFSWTFGFRFAGASKYDRSWTKNILKWSIVIGPFHVARLDAARCDTIAALLRIGAENDESL